MSSSGRALCSSADVNVDFPVDGSPSRRICFAGIDRDEDTESKMDDHRSCGGASGDDGREPSILVSAEQRFGC